MKCIIYARKSTESEERQVQSLEDQLRIMRECAEKRGLVVIEEISESRSAKTPNNRPGFNRLIELIEQGNANAILVWHVNRLTRNPLDGGRLGQLLIDGKLELIQTPERKYVSDDSPIFLAIEAAVAAGQSQNLSRDAKRGMESKAAKGWLPMKPPIGYRNNAENREIDPDPLTFPLVQAAWHLMLGGNHSIREIADELRARFPHFWNMSSENHYRKLYALYRNPFYAGTFKFDGKLYPGKHQAVVSAAEFEFVQRKMARAKGAPRPSKHVPVFLGLIRCAECGGPATVTRARKVSKNGNVHEYTYYHCTGHRGCRKRVVEETKLKEVLSQFARSITIHPKVSEAIVDQIERYFRGRVNVQAESHGLVMEQLTRLRTKLARLTQMRIDSEIDASEYLSSKAAIQAEIQQLESCLEQAGAKVQRAELRLKKLIESGVVAFQCESDTSESNLRNLATRLQNSIFIRHRQVEILLETPLQKIASIKPPLISSESPDRNDYGVLSSAWYTEMRNVLEPVCEEVLAEMGAGEDS